ncbi:MAG: hypothetical protein ACYDA6_11435 [Solirubrobacteraceae bacterium]
MLALGACGATRSASPGHAAGAKRSFVSDPPSAAPTPATPAALERYLGVVRRLYWNELHGRRVHADLAFVARDRRLIELLARGQLGAAQAEAHHLLVGFPIRHITRISLVRSGHVLINAVWNVNGSFVASPLERRITFNGRPLGTLLVSVQDIIGYVKLIRAFTPAQALVRSAAGQVRTSLPAAQRIRLPRSGDVTIAGRPYLVSSYTTHAWGRGPLTREPLTVWLLLAA